jgi:hypothetical protein
MDGKVSLHDPQTNRRLTQAANITDCQPIKLLRWKTRLVPQAPMPTSPGLEQEELLPPGVQNAGPPQVEFDESYTLYHKG